MNATLIPKVQEKLGKISLYTNLTDKHDLKILVLADRIQQFLHITMPWDQRNLLQECECN